MLSALLDVLVSNNSRRIIAAIRDCRIKATRLDTTTLPPSTY